MQPHDVTRKAQAVKRKLGNTELEVSRLGLGLSEIGHDWSANADARAGEVLSIALDNGINFLDTAACYGNSEELIGRYLSGRRDEFILSTKAGHIAGGYTGQPWTAQTVRRARLLSKAGPVPGAPEDRTLTALGFVLAHDSVDTAIVGTSDPGHIRKNIEWFYNNLPIEGQAVEELHKRFDQMGRDWAQQG